MKKITPALIAILFLISCGNKKKLPDVSGIKVDIPIERFDRSFFSMDTSHLETGLVRLKQEHHGFHVDFKKQNLGVSGSPTDTMTLMVTANFFRGYAPIYDSVKKTYNELDWFRKELEKGFQYVKYYFPAYKTGRAIFFLGPFDAPGVASTGNGLAIGLQQYAGSDFSVYQLPEMIDMFPLYISRRFSKEYMAANCMKAVVLELFPDQSKGKPLIEQMVEKGKQWWLLEDRKSVV